MDRSYPLWPLLVAAILLIAYWNSWMWSDSGLVLGLPANLAFHIGLCVTTSLLMVGILHVTWPKDDGEK